MGLLSRFKQKQETSDTQDSGEFRSRAEEESIQTRSRGKKAESARKAKTADPILPEKKRARRRLIGAVALALAAIIGLPMILDSEPKPLADDINIRIPSKDKTADATSTEPAPPRSKNFPPSEPVEEIIETPALPKNKNGKPGVVEKPAALATNTANNANVATVVAQAVPIATTTAKPVKPEVKVEVKPEPKAEVKPVANPAKAAEKEVPASKIDNKADNKADIKPDSKPVKTEAKPLVAKPAAADDEAARALAILEGKTPAKPVVSKPESADKPASYSVQAGAFSMQAKVDEIQAKLSGANIKSYTQKIITTTGEVTRIRVGPFASKEEAEKMRAKLSKLGLNATLPPN
ncbi:SPOR domain-containing protein [Undibacterium sp. TJN19]|uniref:SPOR domain-containing protein n=1 Tax=Undibacterium sp. TJN19 TaxID=3413055 RepID=UPI003BF12506